MTFLAKLRASLTWDRTGNRATTETDAEATFALLDRRLRESRPMGERDPELHRSIMRAVRRSDRERADSAPAFWRCATAAAAVACLAFCVWLLAPRSASEAEYTGQMDVQPMFAVAFSQGRELTQKVPDAALAPLLGEMELLNRDVRSAVNLVVATMP